MWPATLEACIPQLLGILPPKKELMEYLGAFQSRAQSCSFPHVPEEITSTEIERFLADAQNNAEMFPDMLALLFAALAQGSQNGVFDKSGGKWEAGAMEAQQQKVGDVYSKSYPPNSMSNAYSTQLPPLCKPSVWPLS
jgi:hypothetical protein